MDQPPPRIMRAETIDLRRIFSY